MIINGLQRYDFFLKHKLFFAFFYLRRFNLSSPSAPSEGGQSEPRFRICNSEVWNIRIYNPDYLARITNAYTHNFLIANQEGRETIQPVLPNLQFESMEYQDL